MRESAADASETVSTLAQKWHDLHQTAENLAGLAKLAPAPFDDRVAAFGELLGNANDWQRDLARQGVEDIDAMLRPGLAALGTVTARGQDASVPAQALWREFHHAREAVLALVQPLEKPATA